MNNHSENEPMSGARHHRLVRHLAASVLVASVCLLPVASAASELGGPATTARFDFPAASDFVVLEYTMLHGELAEDDLTPLLRIYGDGTVHVHIPKYMKGAGDFRMTLPAESLRSMLASFSNRGVLDFDRARVEGAKADAERARFARTQEYVHISDSSWSVLHVRLGTYDRLGTGLTNEGLDHRIEWPDVAWNLEHYPELTELRAFADAETELRALMAHESLEAFEADTDREVN